MNIERVDLLAFRSLIERLDETIACRAAAAERAEQKTNAERFLTASPRPVCNNSRPEIKAKRRTELRLKAFDAYLSKVAVHGTEEEPNEGAEVVTVSTDLDLARPSSLLNGETKLRLSFSFNTLKDCDAMPGEVGISSWAHDLCLLRPSDRESVRRVSLSEEPLPCSRISLRAILKNKLRTDLAWIPSSERLKNLEAKGKETVGLVTAQNCLESAAEQLIGRIFEASTKNDGRKDVPVIGLRISGQVVPFAVDSFSLPDNSKPATFLTISPETKITFLLSVYLSPIQRTDPGALTETLLPGSATHPVHASLRDALQLPHLFNQLSLPAPKSILLSGPPGVGKKTLLLSACRQLGIGCHLLRLAPIIAKYEEADSDDEDEDSDLVSEVFEKAHLAGPACVAITDVDTLSGGRKKDARNRAKVVGQLVRALKKTENVILVGISEESGLVLPAGLFDVTHLLHPPSISERKEILESLLSRYDAAAAQWAEEASAMTPGWVAGDLEAVVRTCVWGSAASQEQVSIPKERLLEAVGIVGAGKGTGSVKARREGARDEFGGYTHLLVTLTHLLTTSLLTPTSFTRLGTTPPRGILLHGPPGSGKSHLARLLCSDSRINTIECEATSVFSKYLGDSEAYLRGLLARAREEAPCVILFDPLDSLAARRGAGSDSGVSERVLSTLLNELDGIEDRVGVFVIGVTDRVEQVDEAVLRPGRFDRVVQIPEPTDEDRSGIVDVLRKRTRMEDGVAERIVERTEGWTAGEIVGLVREAAGIAMRRSFEADQVSWADFEESFASALRIRAETEE